MADNILVTQGSGTTMATDDISSVQYPRVKISWGVDGSAVDASASNPFPVVQTGTLNIGTVTTVTTVAAVTAISNALPAGNNNIGDVDVASVVPGTGATNLGKAEDAAHTSGDVGVMALAVRSDAGTAFGADGDYVPLSTDSNGALRVTGGGGGTQYNVDSVAGATDTGTLGLYVRTDSLSTLTPADGDYVQGRTNSVGRIWTSATIDAALPAGSNAIGKLSANSGIDIGDVDVTSILPGSGATNLGKAEDAVHSSGDVGVEILAVRRDSAAAGAADGDYATVNVDANGKLWTNAEITATINIPVTDAGGSLTVDNAGTFAVQSTSVIPGTSATSLGKAVDDAGGGTDTGVAALVIRKDTLATLTPADGDYTRLMSTSVGRLWVSAAVDTALPAGTNAIGKLSANSGVDIGDVDVTSVTPGTAAASLGKAEDAAHTSGDTGVAILGVRRDSATSGCADGDYATINVDANGKLWTSPAARTVDTISTALATDAIMESTTALTPKFATIAVSSSGNNTIVASVSSKKIRVLAVQLISNGTVNVKWQSGASGTDITGLAYLVVNTGYVLPFNPVGWFETAATTLLNLNLSAAIAVGGSITYVEAS